MSSFSVAVTPRVDPNPVIGDVVPMFVCAGCRPTPLGYASFTHGDGLEGMAECPCRDVCTWYAGHDLGGTVEYDELPTAGQMAAAFKLTPYFSCANFNDYEAYLAKVRNKKGEGKSRTVRIDTAKQSGLEAVGEG